MNNELLYQVPKLQVLAENAMCYPRCKTLLRRRAEWISQCGAAIALREKRMLEREDRGAVAASLLLRVRLMREYCRDIVGLVEVFDELVNACRRNVFLVSLYNERRLSPNQLLALRNRSSFTVFQKMENKTLHAVRRRIRLYRGYLPVRDALQHLRNAMFAFYEVTAVEHMLVPMQSASEKHVRPVDLTDCFHEYVTLFWKLFLLIRHALRI